MKAGHGSHPLGTHGWLPLLVAAALILVLTLTLEASPAAAASRKSCRVRDADSGQTYTALQAAVDAATRGGRLMVHGTCLGRVVIDRGLVIQGQRALDGRSLLDGDREGVVLTIRKGVSVKVTDLAIEGGRGHFRKGSPEKPHNWPGGVLNHGNLTLRDVMVRRNQGLAVENTGRLRLNGHSVIGNNWGMVEAKYKHPGIHNAGTLRLNGTSTVRKNEGLVNDGSLILHGASSVNVIHNRGSITLHDTGRVARVSNRGSTALHDAGSVGWVTNRGALTLGDESRMGIVDNFGTLTMNDASSVSSGTNHSSMTLDGSSAISAGRFGNYGTLTLNGSASISGGRWHSCGVPSGLCLGDPRIFGVGVRNGGRLVLNDSSSISGNWVQPSASGLFSFGGGVYMVRDPSLPEPPSLTMTGSATITGNAADQGGGIYAVSGSILNGVSCGPGGNVYDNTPDDCYIEP